MSILSTSLQRSAEEMPPKKGKGRAKRSHPDAEEVTTEGQVNVNIHPAPPEEDMPAEAVHPQAEAVPPPESRGNLQLVVQPVVAICDRSCNQSWQSAVGRATSRGNLRVTCQRSDEFAFPTTAGC